MGEDEEFKRRKDLTFLQAEGHEPLPQQLKREEVSDGFRAKLLNLFRHYILDYDGDVFGGGFVYDNVIPVFENEWVNRQEKYADELLTGDEFDNRAEIYQSIKKFIVAEDGKDVLDFVQFILREKTLDPNIRKSIKDLFVESNMAYRVYGNPPTLIPLSSEEDAEAVLKSLDTLREAKQKGASTHLKNAAESLRSGNFSDSVRESIHAVESTVKRIAGKDKATLTDGLKVVENATDLHPALKKAFNQLYGYTSDEKGVRHASIDGDEMVDEHLALFMFSTCASFCAYLVNVTRK
ncbi:MAG: hypothetical protein Q9M33_12480 [Robiginitomaculum sp.]|nr:hypothetical protein [Robiginitomaculum sp.]MDQ7077874.1 hypothetical protein [Robiginitomaculum sp.]